MGKWYSSLAEIGVGLEGGLAPKSPSSLLLFSFVGLKPPLTTHIDVNLVSPTEILMDFHYDTALMYISVVWVTVMDVF